MVSFMVFESFFIWLTNILKSLFYKNIQSKDNQNAKFSKSYSSGRKIFAESMGT